MANSRETSTDESDDEFEECPTDANIYSVAKLIGHKWRALGRILKLTRSELENIEHDYHHFGQEEFAVQVMIKWKESNAKEAKKKILIHALVSIRIERDEIVNIFPRDEVPLSDDGIITDCPTDANTDSVAKLVGHKWRALGRKLKLKEPEMDNIEYDYYYQEEYAVQVMIKWKECNGKEAKTKILIQALVSIGIKRDEIVKIFPRDEVPLLDDDDITTDSGFCDLPMPVHVASLPQKCPELSTLNGYSVVPKHVVQESYNTNDIKIRIQKQMRRQKTIELPGVSWLVKKFLPLDKLFVDLEMYEKDELGNEKLGVDVELHQIFDSVNGEKPTRILLEGNPGYGKTTLIHKLFSDWVNRAQYMPPTFILIFIISLRDFQGTLDDFFCHQILTDKFSDCLNGISDATKQKLLRENEENILLLLDGYDELSEESKRELSRLLEEKQYPLMTVIVTSRPGQFHIPNSSNLTRQSYQQQYNNIFWQKRIEIKGISENKREEFLENYLGKNFNLYEKLPSSLRHQIYELFECPLYLLLIAFSIEKENAKNIDDRTSLYKIAINFLIKRNLIRDEVIKDDVSLDVFSSNQNAAKYKSLLLKFGELSLKLLKNNRLFITDDDILKYFDNKSDLIQLGFVVKNIRIFSYDEEEKYEVVHKTFMEFLAAYYITTNLLGNTDGIKNEICGLIKADITPINNEMFFGFLSGLMGTRFFEILLSWKFIYPLNRHPIKSYFLEQKNPELSTISLLIPSYWPMDGSAKNFPKSKYHSSLMRMGERKCLIQTIKWSINCAIFIPLTINVPLLVLEIKETNAKDLIGVISKLQNVKGRKINCVNLLCKFFTFDPNISELIFQIFSFINPRHIGISVYGINDNFRSLLFFLKRCMEGIWSRKDLTALGLHEIKIAEIDQHSFTLLIQLINEYISQGLGIHMNDRTLDETCKSHIQEIIKVASYSRINEFALSIKSRTTFNVDTELLSRFGNKQWKALYFQGDIVFSHPVNFVPLIIEKVEFFWKIKSVEQSSKFISSSSMLTVLKCDMPVLKSFADMFASQCKSMKELRLLLLNNTFHPYDINALKCFSNLEMLSLDLADLRNPSSFQEIPKILLNVLPNLKLKILAVRRIEERAVVFVTNLLDGIKANVPKEKLPLFHELNLWLTCEATVEFINCMNIVKDLFKQKLLKRFLLTDLRGFNSLQDLVCKIFDIREFNIKRSVKPILTEDIILCNKDLTYTENITEVICIETIN